MKELEEILAKDIYQEVVYLKPYYSKLDLSWANTNINNLLYILIILEYFQHSELLSIFELISKK